MQGSKGKLTKNRPDETPRLSEEEPKRTKDGKESAKRTRKAKARPEKEGDDGNPETQPGTPVSSLMQVQKEKLTKNRPRRDPRLSEEEPKRTKEGKESANIIHTEISFPACTKNSTTEVKVVE